MAQPSSMSNRSFHAVNVPVCSVQPALGSSSLIKHKMLNQRNLNISEQILRSVLGTVWAHEREREHVVDYTIVGRIWIYDGNSADVKRKAWVDVQEWRFDVSDIRLFRHNPQGELSTEWIHRPDHDEQRHEKACSSESDGCNHRRHQRTAAQQVLDMPNCCTSLELPVGERLDELCEYQSEDYGEDRRILWQSQHAV
jgi:hypothetical protein